MKKLYRVILISVLIFALLSCMNSNKKVIESEVTKSNQTELSLNDTVIKKVIKTDAQWKKDLTQNQYFILRQQGTEPPFDNEFYDNHQKGYYFCAGCKLPLFSSKTKFESGKGWPSFFAPLSKTRVKEVTDTSLGMVRGETQCARCEGHLGHVFDDGPAPTGLRYCMDSGALLFLKSK
jgi:peptide-methionine (R)-S-oxide reductase